MRYYILITGASTGIGESACKAFHKAGYKVIAGVRKEEDALRLISGIESGIHPVIMDVTRDDMMLTARHHTEKIIGSGALVAIVNNAGIVVHGATLYIPVEEWQRQFDVNVMGVVRTTQLFFPLLVQRSKEEAPHPRRIINIGSISGLFASPFMAPYCASKYALEAISDSLRRELYMHDVQVVLIEAGNIQTPIWQKAMAEPSYFGPEYSGIQEFKNKVIASNLKKGLPLAIMDSVLLNVVRNKKVRVRYLVRAQKWKFRLIQLLPTKWVDKIMRNKLQEKSGIRPF